MTGNPRPSIHWQTFSDKLLHHFLSKTGDSEVAKDLRQETLLKVWENMGRLQHQEKQWAWIWTIARNVLTDHWRAKGKIVPDDIEPLDMASEELLRLAKQCMNELVDKLPEPYKEAITLSELEGMKQTELAKKLGMSDSGAKSRVQRGRKMLKEMMFDCCEFSLNEKGQWENEKWMGCG